MDEDHACWMTLEQVVDEGHDGDDGGGRSGETEAGETLNEGGDERDGKVTAHDQNREDDIPRVMRAHLELKKTLSMRRKRGR